jgi:hypothetical protein
MLETSSASSMIVPKVEFKPRVEALSETRQMALAVGEVIEINDSDVEEISRASMSTDVSTTLLSFDSGVVWITKA